MITVNDKLRRTQNEGPWPGGTQENHEKSQSG